MLKRYYGPEERRKQTRIAEEEIAQLEIELERKINEEEEEHRAELKRLGPVMAFLKYVNLARYLSLMYEPRIETPVYENRAGELVLN